VDSSICRYKKEDLFEMFPTIKNIKVEEKKDGEEEVMPFDINECFSN